MPEEKETSLEVAVPDEDKPEYRKPKAFPPEIKESFLKMDKKGFSDKYIRSQLANHFGEIVPALYTLRRWRREYYKANPVEVDHRAEQMERLDAENDDLEEVGEVIIDTMAPGVMEILNDEKYRKRFPTKYVDQFRKWVDDQWKRNETVRRRIASESQGITPHQQILINIQNNPKGSPGERERQGDLSANGSNDGTDDRITVIDVPVR